MDILDVTGPILLLGISLQVLLIFIDLDLAYTTKKLLFKWLVVVVVILAIISFFYLPGSWKVKILFSVLNGVANFFYYRSIRFCVNCAYPLSRTNLPKKFCPKCGIEVTKT